MRQIVLDTETTGLEPELGHRIIEIGCVEIVNRRPTGRTFHHYLNPDRDIDKGAAGVHGITLEQLKDKPRFADVAEELMTFISGRRARDPQRRVRRGLPRPRAARCAAQKVAAFAGRSPTPNARVLDSLALARQMHPGQRNNLDALCKRYSIDNSHRGMHGALLDARILADVYLALTGGQVGLALGVETAAAALAAGQVRALVRPAVPLIVVSASSEELKLHDAMLAVIGQGKQSESASGRHWSPLRYKWHNRLQVPDLHRGPTLRHDSRRRRDANPVSDAVAVRGRTIAIRLHRNPNRKGISVIVLNMRKCRLGVSAWATSGCRSQWSSASISIPSASTSNPIASPSSRPAGTALSRSNT